MNTTSNLAGRFLLPVCLGIASFAFTPSADAQLVIIDGFELGEGHFNLAPDFSGTSQGMIKAAGPQDTTADQTFTTAFTGSASQRLVVFDDIAVGGTPAAVDSWRVRHLSGGGTITNNLSLAIVSGGTGFVGYWLKTSSLGLEASIGIDDGAAALEIGRWQPIIADGNWHLYEWQFQDAVDWDPFAGLETNGQIDQASVTIDSVFIRAGVGFGIGTAFDAEFVIDDVSYNPTGSAVPEPSSMLIGLVGLSYCLRRRRR
jgi:hypothetical protein